MDKNKAENTITIKTSHGVRHVNKKDIIHFHGGLLGFDEFTDYAIFDIKDCEPFMSMLSIEKGGPELIVIEPIGIFEDYYPFSLPGIPEKLDIGNTSEIIVLSIVTLDEDPENITVNLRGPLFINPTTSEAKQIVLPDDRYATRVPMLVNE